MSLWLPLLWDFVNLNLVSHKRGLPATHFPSTEQHKSSRDRGWRSLFWGQQSLRVEMVNLLKLSCHSFFLAFVTFGLTPIFLLHDAVAAGKKERRQSTPYRAKILRGGNKEGGSE